MKRPRNRLDRIEASLGHPSHDNDDGLWSICIHDGLPEAELRHATSDGRVERPPQSLTHQRPDETTAAAVPTDQDATERGDGLL